MPKSVIKDFVPVSFKSGSLTMASDVPNPKYRELDLKVSFGNTNFNACMFVSVSTLALWTSVSA